MLRRHTAYCVMMALLTVLGAAGALADAGRNAVESSDWGEVEYIGNSEWIRRIGNMDVEYIGSTNWIRRIGPYDVEYIGSTDWIRRIGNMNVEYIGSTNWIMYIGNRKSAAGAATARGNAKTATDPSAAPAALAAAVPFRSIKEQLGVDTVASVERDIKERGGSPGSIRDNGQGIPTLSTMSGDYSDVGPYVAAVTYNFDGTGSAARLVAVMVAHSFGVYGDAYKKLADERKAILAKDFGALQMKSATEYSSAAGGYELTLFEKPDMGYFYERYKLAR